MAEKIRVMIVDDIPETREQLRKLLSFDPDIEVVAMVGSGEEAVSTVTKTIPDVILMDINLPGIDGITATGKVVELIPTVQVIMLSVQGETDYMRRAMMAGARDYLTKPPSADELLDTIHRVFKLRQKMQTGPLSPATLGAARGGQATPTIRQGKVITLYSPKGGTGCTTTAVNVSIAMQAMLGTDYKICLVDTNLQFGDVVIFMKLQPSRTLTDLAQHAQDLDPDLFNTILVPHSSGVKVLAAPQSPEEAEIFQEGGVEDTGANSRLKTILNFARQEYDYIIIDTAHQVDDILLATLDLSDLFLIVTRPTIPEIRGARQFVELLQKLNYSFDRIGLVINSVDNKRMGIQPEAIERAMMPAIVHIPLDERIALKAANYGVPLIIQNAKTPLGQAIAGLAKSIHSRLTEAPPEQEDTANDTQRRGGGLGRLL
ncbi:MAG: response regulator [Anaerolineae bacterium]|nr:response regulator [Anaerolineae bacterium]